MSTGSAGTSIGDPHSFSRPDEVVVTHIDLDLSVSFEKRELAGTATLRLDRRSDANELWLDTRDLHIDKVELLPSGEASSFTLGDAAPLLGNALTIPITYETNAVRITYRSSPNAAAVQWLTPEQTLGGKKPFLFTQSQAILARTWIPCQDTPGVRTTYTARIDVPEGLVALMSAAQAENTAPAVDGRAAFAFRMDEPIPSYLFALAVGDLAFRAIGERSGVYAEPALVEKAAWEFADTEKMIERAEELYGPYRWGRYDILVLPPSFPFGGMENPRLTFATPTIIAGDRSLVALIAHELAHSWSGNLVTNANWDDFWLNEGFTVYFEHRIMEEVYGKDYEQMLASLSMDGLQETIEDIGPRHADTHLRLSLAGRDPDDGMTAIAYDKGHFFLRSLEEIVGREEWDAYLKGYFDRRAFQSTTSEQFLADLREHLVRGRADIEEKMQLDAWVYGPGLPSNCAAVGSAAFKAVENELARWRAGTPASELATAKWTTHEWLHFIRALDAEEDSARLAELDAAFKLTNAGNSEVLCAWLLVATDAWYEPALPALENFLVSVGRRKFLQPLYERLAKTPRGLEFAKRVYEKARPGYHVISSGTIDGIVGYSAD